MKTQDAPLELRLWERKMLRSKQVSSYLIEKALNLAYKKASISFCFEPPLNFLASNTDIKYARQ